MAYSVPNLNPSSATYPRVVNGGALSAVGSKNLHAASVGFINATEDVKAYYTEIFNKHANVQENLLKQLNAVFGTNIGFDGNRHVNFTDFIKDVCVDSDQANDAYKFYGRQIIEQINQLGDYILKARALLDQVTEGKNWIIDQLDILDGFSKEMNETFGFRYIYDLNEDIWKLYEDDYTNATHTQFHKKDDTYKPYDKLRTMQVQAYKKQEYQKDPAFDEKTIEVFNELNLLDRLKYIKLYYDIDSGKTDALFPNDKINGIPTVKETSKTDVMAAIEHFFMGYLIDRDGPVNAVASYLEVKSAALIEKIRLESEKIKALNVYLKFIQRALDVLNASQSGAKDNEKDDKGEIKTHDQHRLPDGVMVALTFLCSGNMYNLFKADNETQCLVIENDKEAERYMLVPANTAGMNLLLGDNGTEEGCVGNCGTWIKKEEGMFWFQNFYSYEHARGKGTEAQRINTFAAIPDVYYTTENKGRLPNAGSGDNRYIPKSKSLDNNFVLPPKLDVEQINPQSVRRYSEFWSSDEITTETVSSWQKAFQNKLSFIQTSIETVNTDIKVFRNKVDTLNTLGNTFRNRTHTAYMKIGSNLKK